MKPHYEHESEVTINTVTQSETLLNNHSKSWAKILMMGARQGEGMNQRIIEALMVHSSTVPNLLGFRKDH